MRKTLAEYLDKSNDKLLHAFGWGNEGEQDFNQFMRLVRELVNSDTIQLKQELDTAKTILNDCVNASAVCNATDYDMMRSKAYEYLSK